MKVFKFGGASINSAERIKNTGNILKLFPNEKIVVIISAMGKTTNALEEVVNAFYEGDKTKALSLFEKIKEEHNDLTKNLVGEKISRLNDLFTEVEWLLHDKPVREYDYYYDQIVCLGELLSTAIISNYFNKTGINNVWIDVRDIMRTDDNFRDALINWEYTQQKADDVIQPLLVQNNIVITQGFIGSTDENESTTLGREGSDYTAAIFANMLDAENQTIWKDVEGVMNADPKKFPEATFIETLPYDEVIEMAYYGAQVIHPKTIKPLQNKGIPLHVRCFLKPELKGTIISSTVSNHNLPPIIVVKENQVLMQLSSKDFSFVEESPVDRIHEFFHEIKMRPNLSQNGAISILFCLDDRADKIEKLALASSALFDVQVEKGLSLLTIRHYNTETIEKLLEGKTELLRQQTKETIQVIVKN